MELIVKGTFFRDINSISNLDLLSAIAEKVKEIEAAHASKQIVDLKKLRKYKFHFRIKIADVYRIGAMIRGNKIWFIRFGHRSNFYKKFP